jgi:hypothetical protein
MNLDRIGIKKSVNDNVLYILHIVSFFKELFNFLNFQRLKI